MSMYLNTIFNAKKIKDVLLSIKDNHNYYMNRPENVILQYYDMQGSKITFYYASYVYVTVVAYITIPAVSLTFDLIRPSNYSQEKSFPIELDYGVDTQQYFYYLFVHSYVTIAIIANLIASCDTTYMLYAQHAYALFAIVSFELRTVHILDTNVLMKLKDRRLLEMRKNIELLSGEQKQMHSKLFLCIKEHQNAIKYSKLVESLFTKSIFAQLFFNVVCLTIAGVETVMKLGNAADMIRFGSFTFAQAIHIFVLCLPGQRLLNHNEEVHAAACEAMWYIFPKNCHNTYKFLLARTSAFSKITALKMATMSMETFLAIIQSAMSYFTVLSSVT
ncbi:odorant receptor 13a-like [Frieseomelitta varia]|uniref:odorant receptor 13a-like n=1 Tax=Frieseomelitta varia TaxID=561572 RepID=UPI001CB6823C|nr:odorant receptor 13a-like [Frieseomelitta varia]